MHNPKIVVFVVVFVVLFWNFQGSATCIQKPNGKLSAINEFCHFWNEAQKKRWISNNGLTLVLYSLYEMFSFFFPFSLCESCSMCTEIHYKLIIYSHSKCSGFLFSFFFFFAFLFSLGFMWVWHLLFSVRSYNKILFMPKERKKKKKEQHWRHIYIMLRNFCFSPSL